jgi:hypothetical protein
MGRWWRRLRPPPRSAPRKIRGELIAPIVVGKFSVKAFQLSLKVHWIAAGPTGLRLRVDFLLCSDEPLHHFSVRNWNVPVLVQACEECQSPSFDSLPCLAKDVMLSGWHRGHIGCGNLCL